MIDALITGKPYDSSVTNEINPPVKADSESKALVTDNTRHRGYKNPSATLEATTGAGCHGVADRTPFLTSDDELKGNSDDRVTIESLDSDGGDDGDDINLIDDSEVF